MPIFIGGDTQSFYYDMQFKVANSVAENPNKIFWQDIDLTTLPNPSTGWTEITTQSDIDSLKKQDNISLTYSTTANGKAKAIMMAVDLTTVCNTLYGSSNSALLAALKAIQVDVWASGSGANSGVTANGVSVYMFKPTDSSYHGNAQNLLGAIDQITLSNTIDPQNYVSTDNKIYILIVSQYASDGVIASTVNLDYITVRVDLWRQKDIITPIQINVPQTWSLLIKGFSASWDNTDNNDRKIIVLYKDGDDTNGHWMGLIYNRSYTGGFYIGERNNIVFTKVTNGLNMSNKYNIINFLISYTNRNVTLYMLTNNGIITKTSGAATFDYSILNQLYILQHLDKTCQADAFVDSIIFIPNKTFDDVTAEDILRGNVSGLMPGFKFPELIASNNFSDATKWTLSGSANITNNTLTLPNVQDTAYQNITVFPNNKYHVDITTQDNQGIVEAQEYYNNNYIRSTLLGAGLSDLVTTPYTNKIRVLLKNQLQGFTRNSPVYLSNGTQVAANTPRLEQGYFGNAIMIEEGTTNLLLNPSFESWSSGIPVSWSKGSAATVTQVTGRSGTGYAVRFSVTIGGNQSTGRLTSTGILQPNTTYTISYYARRISGTGTLAIAIDNTGYPLVQSTGISSSWQRFSDTITTASNSSNTLNFVPSNANDVFEIDDVQLEAKPYATSFIDSTRAAETLTIPTTGVLNPQEGTVECWVNPYVLPAATRRSQRIFMAYPNTGNSNNALQLFINSDGRWRFSYGFNSNYTYLYGATAQANTWTHLAIRWDSSGGALFVNGVKVATDTHIPSLQLDKCNIGSDNNSTEQLNGLIDDIRISNRARTDEEIAQAYASEQPLPVDGNTTLKMDFDNLGAIFNNVSLKLKM